LNASSATLSWGDKSISQQLINPVTGAVVDLSKLSVKASVSADGTTVTLTPPAELDWMKTDQILKATFSYKITDAGGLSSENSMTLTITGSTNDKGFNLNGGNGNDVLSGSASVNAEDVLQGGNGNDTLSGHGGTDALYGDNGDDKLAGGAGIDYLYGDSGNDTLDGGTEGDVLFGGKGNDIVTGGLGADKFVFAPQYGNDRIMDFKASEGDKLFFLDFFSTPMTEKDFLSKYVTDTGNDLLISLPGGSITLVGVANVGDLTGLIAFGMPA
jgi:Ca2+-binding RTX toxin-like protein